MQFLSDVPINFPGLGIGEINPSSGFTFPGTDFEIKYYGVLIAFGVLLAVIYAMRRAKQFGLTSDDILNVAIVGLPCAIIGARLYYVVFYGTPWSDFFKIRDGGLAIYGGVIGAVLGLMVFFLSGKKRRAKLLPSFDVCGIGLLIGQAVGRWGNFLNREAFGEQTDSFLRMGLKMRGEWTFYHPTFLYESVWNLAGLVLLHFLSKKRKFDGQVFLYYIAWYGMGRLWIEGLRTDSLYLGGTGIRVSQLLAGVSCIAAATLILVILLKNKPDGSGLLVNRAVPVAVEAPVEVLEATEEELEARIAQLEAEADEASEETEQPMEEPAEEAEEETNI